MTRRNLFIKFVALFGFLQLGKLFPKESPQIVKTPNLSFYGIPMKADSHVPRDHLFFVSIGRKT